MCRKALFQLWFSILGLKEYDPRDLDVICCNCKPCYSANNEAFVLQIKVTFVPFAEFGDGSRSGSLPSRLPRLTYDMH